MGKSKQVCVITGGGSGIGLAAARVIGKHAVVILAGRTESRLDRAASELQSEHISAHPFVCDVADEGAVRELAAFAQETGKVTAVIHSAGLSPHMGDVETIIATNATGTININDAFFPVVEEGACIVDIASMSAYLIPGWFSPRRHYPLSRKDKQRFLKKMMSRVRLFPRKMQPSMAYAFSKDFIIWFARTDAARFGEKRARVISVSPGNFETPMSEFEHERASLYVAHSAMKRFGRVEEIAYLLDACLDPRLGYLTGTDILIDGGSVASGYSPLRWRR